MKNVCRPEESLNREIVSILFLISIRRGNNVKITKPRNPARSNEVTRQSGCYEIRSHVDYSITFNLR